MQAEGRSKQKKNHTEMSGTLGSLVVRTREGWSVRLLDKEKACTFFKVSDPVGYLEFDLIAHITYKSKCIY